MTVHKQKERMFYDVQRMAARVARTLRKADSESTYERYRQLSLHILPHLGEYDVNALTPMVLQKYVSELLVSGNRKTGRGLSPNTVNAIISLMQNALKAALAAGAVQTYTAGKIKRPKNTEKPVECFLLAEQKAMERYVLNGKKPKMTAL